MKSLLPEVTGSGTSLLGVITANQVELDYWLRIFATLVAITAGLMTIWSLWRKRG